MFHKIFIYTIEVIYWLKIVASPLLAGLGLGANIYFNNSNDITMTIWFILGVVGLIVGIIWATRVWKRYGTSRYISKIQRTPELDPPDEDDEVKNFKGN